MLTVLPTLCQISTELHCQLRYGRAGVQCDCVGNTRRMTISVSWLRTIERILDAQCALKSPGWVRVRCFIETRLAVLCRPAHPMSNPFADPWGSQISQERHELVPIGWRAIIEKWQLISSSPMDCVSNAKMWNFNELLEVEQKWHDVPRPDFARSIALSVREGQLFDNSNLLRDTVGRSIHLHAPRLRCPPHSQSDFLPSESFSPQSDDLSFLGG